jgi:hypothetical protein
MRRLAAAAAVLAGAAVIAAPASATNPLSDQRQLTQSAAGTGAISPSVAYNSKKRQWLVVYQSSAGGDLEVVGQRLSDLGDPIGAPFSVSNLPGAATSAFAPVAAYNRKTNHYFVAFIADAAAADDEFEVFGQRVSAGGDRAGSPVRISQVGTDGDIDTRPDGAFGPAIAENPDDDQFLVAWSGDHATDDKNEISIQRVAATGNEIGPETQVSTTPGNDSRDAQAPSVAYNEEAREFLVVWHQDGFAADNERDVFGQRLNSGAVPVGADDFRISETGPDGDPDLGGADPSVAANSQDGEYLVAFSASLAPSEELEIKVQVLAPDGAQVDVNDARISDVAGEGDLTRSAFAPAVAFSPAARQFVVAYGADDLGPAGEHEAFVQRIGADGEELGDNDVRVSALAPDGNPDFGLDTVGEATQPLAIAANSQLSEWLVPFAGDTAVDDRFDVFSRRIGLSGKCGGKVARVAGPGRDLIKLGKQRDVVAAKGGRDNVRGQGGKDRICGGKGKDRLSGGKGRDRLLGQKGKDRCLGGKGRDRAKSCERTGSI